MSAAEAHPPTHELAGLAEGVLDDARAREVQAHVDQCLTCQGTLDELAQVTVALRALPAERPIPEFVAARISHALAAERSSGTPAGGVGGGDAEPAQAGGDSGTVAWFRRRLPQGLAAAASVAVLGLAGYVAVGGGNGGSDDSGSAAEDAAVAGAGEPASAFDSPPTGSRVGPPSTVTGTPTPSDTPQVAQGQPEEDVDVDPAELTASAQDIIRMRSNVISSCGENLAEQQGLELVGSARDFAGVVVVLDAGTTYQAWLIDTCNSVDVGQLVPPVDVPKGE
ncbi:anti-sigma factor family protein [Jiangella rhizosphaerae]|nr:hypothetical protein [Jiangella rhizosphaerae]